MADYIEINTATLSRDRSTIQSELDRAGSEIDQLRDQMASLGAMWEGPAHDSFLQQFESDYEFIQEFKRQLEEYISMMEFAANEYQRCETTVQEAIASIRI